MKKDFVLFTDATCDLPVSVLEESDIQVIPMLFEIDGKSYMHYPDARELSFSDFYNQLRAGKSAVTSQINYNDYLSCFEPWLKQGKDIVYIAFSSGLSGTYNASQIAIHDLQEQYPACKIFSIDSFAASVGEGMLVYYAAKQAALCDDAEALVQWIETAKNHLCHWFTVDDLNHLKRGGRVSTVAAVMGTALGIKPILHVDDTGHLIPMEKVRGRRKSLEALLEHMEKTCIQPEKQTIFIGHGDSEADAILLRDMVLQKLPAANVILSYIGPIIGSHSGPGTIALFYFGEYK